MGVKVQHSRILAKIHLEIFLPLNVFFLKLEVIILSWGADAAPIGRMLSYMLLFQIQILFLLLDLKHMFVPTYPIDRDRMCIEGLESKMF